MTDRLALAIRTAANKAEPPPLARRAEGPSTSSGAAARRSRAGWGRIITLRCIELVGGYAYAETELLEKWGRDSKVLDIFEGTQQIQMLIISRQLLGKTSADSS
jgi:acyl-CoA dehydrogenase